MNGASRRSTMILVSTTIGSGSCTFGTERSTTLPGIDVVVCLRRRFWFIDRPIFRHERLKLEPFANELGQGLFGIAESIPQLSHLRPVLFQPFLQPRRLRR